MTDHADLLLLIERIGVSARDLAAVDDLAREGR